jgi:tetratricopeptide (TPR) repeat protein
MFANKNRIIGLILLILLASSIAGSQEAKDFSYTTKSPEALKYFLDGVDLIDNFRYGDASQLFERAIKADSAFAMAYDYWAATATSGEEGIKRINKAVELAATASEPERLTIMADKAISENKMDMARQYIGRLVELLPASKRAHYIFATFLDSQREDTEAEKEYHKTIAIDPNFAAAYNNYAYFLSRLGRYPEALDALKKYAELKPLEPNPHDSMGEIYLWMGDYTNSIKEYENSLKLNPRFVASIAGLGHNYVFKGEFEQARAKYSEMCTHAYSAGDTNTAYYWEATSYLYEKKYDAAIAVLQEQLSFIKARNDIYQEPNIHSNLAIVYREKGDFDKALGEAALERELAMNPGIESATRQGYIRDCLALQASILARQGKIDQAKAALAEYLKSIEGINDPALMRNYRGVSGVVAYFNKDYQGAIDELKQSDPANQYYRYYLGLSFELTGNNVQARKLFAEVASYNRNGLMYAIVRPLAAAKL